MTEPEANAPDYFDVVLVAPGPNRAKCFALLKDILQCDAKEAKSQIDSGRVHLATGSQLTTKDVVTAFKAVGAQLELVPAQRPGWQSPPPLSPKMQSALASQERLLRENRLKKFAEIRRNWGSTLHNVIDRLQPDSEGALDVLNAIVGWRAMNRQPMSIADAMIEGCQSFDREVNNGGLHQYFFNSSGNLWRHVLQTLIDGHDPDGEAHFRETMSVFPNGEPSEDRDERIGQLQRMAAPESAFVWEHFGRQTDSFYRSPYPTAATLWAALKNRPDEEFVPMDE